MHPLLKTPKQFLTLGLLWSPFCFWVIFLLVRGGDISFGNAALLSVPPMGLELFICLGTWYICRTTVLNDWYMLKTIWVHVVAAVLMISSWLLLAFLYAEVLDLVSKTGAWGDRFARAFPVFLAVGVSLYFIAILAHYLVLVDQKKQRAEQEMLRQKVLAGQAELKAVKATIHPHFLFNSLNMLRPLIRIEAERAQQVVAQLSDFLLYSLRYGKQELVTAGDEMEHIKNYLGIETARLGERLKLRFDIDESALHTPMPPLTLLPLVENAIKHGISQCLEGGVLEITLKREKGDIRIDVSNPYEKPHQPVRGEGLGIQTVKQRLAAYFGPTGQLVTKKGDTHFQVTLYFPSARKKTGPEAKTDPAQETGDTHGATD